LILSHKEELVELGVRTDEKVGAPWLCVPPFNIGAGSRTDNFEKSGIF